MNKNILSSNFEVKKILSKIKLKEKKSNENVDKVLQKNIDSVYNRDWNKLEKGFQKNRLSQYVIIEQEKNNLNQNQVTQLKTIINQCYNKKLLNSNVVTYNKETAAIENISIIDFDSEKNIYFTIKKEVKKKKKKKIYTSKTKNINLISKYLKKNNDYKQQFQEEKETIKNYIQNMEN